MLQEDIEKANARLVIYLASLALLLLQDIALHFQ